MAALAGLVLLGGAGCGTPKTYPTQGKVVLPKGGAPKLTGWMVECKLSTDDNVRASGEINEDGTFTLTTDYKGRTLPGAQEGSYLARLIFNGGDDADQTKVDRSLDPRYMDFATSGLTFSVPSETDVTLTLAPRGPASRPTGAPRSEE